MNTFQSDAGEGPSTLQEVVPPLFIRPQFISDTEGQHKTITKDYLCYVLMKERLSHRGPKRT